MTGYKILGLGPTVILVGHTQATQAEDIVSQLGSSPVPHPLLVIRSAEQLAVRARILAVARRIFAHSRHGQISITDIARAADLPEDEVQLHFGDMAAVEAAVHRVFGSDRYTACRQVVELVKVREDAHLAL